MQQQIPLALKLNDASRFDNFYYPTNRAVMHSLQDQNEQFVYIWGAQGNGKTHLLHASCFEFMNKGKNVFYLSLADGAIVAPDVLDDVEQYDLICLDDVETVVNHSQWEAKLFHLYNAVRDNGHCMRVASTMSPTALPLDLPDLISRMCSGPVYQIMDLSDQQKVDALQLRASNRGMQLEDKLANYLLQHYTRDMHSLFTLLDKLEVESIAAQRKLTIPFVKKYL